jgi:uncharacterized protein YegP (UPF0339 family)/outer membrane protein OmpA-like peptidoglycan-associated protein
MKFLVSQQEDGKFSFTLSDNDANLVLSSISFNDRNTAIEAIRELTQVLPNITNYQVVSDDGEWFFNVLSEGEIIGFSPKFPSVDGANEASNSLSEDTSDEPQYSVEVHTYSKSATTVTREQVALPSLGEIDFTSLYDFGFDSPKGTRGFESFTRADKISYFHFNDADGTALLYSRGFDANSKREKRIRQVIAASNKPQRYEVIGDQGVFYFILKERNNLEIARSRAFTSITEASDAVTYLQNNAPNYANAYPEPVKRKNVNQYNFDLKSSNVVGFEVVKGEDKQHYFVLKDGSGTPVLYSQGYGSGTARDNGIKTVIKNGIEESRYEKSDLNGSYSFILRAGNRQEVAKSPNFETSEQRDKALAWLLLNISSYATQYGVTYNTKEIITENTESFTIDMPTPILAIPLIKPNNNMQIDSYLACESYAGHSESPAEDFRIFQNSDNNEHYFTMLSKSGKVVFRSEGYPTVAARNNGLASVQKNRELRERYSIIEDDGKTYLILKAGNHQEIARSCPFASQDDVFALYPFMVAGSTVAISFDDTIAAVESSSDREIDDYLPCDAYKGHEDSPADGIRTFQSDKDNQYYFSVVNKDEDVILRSEGYPTKGARDNGVASVIKNREIKERYAEIEEDGLHYIILKAGNHQEIARSCPSNDKAGLWVLFPLLGLGLAGLGFGASAGKGEIAGATLKDSVSGVEASGDGIGAGVIGAGLAGAAALGASALIPEVEKTDDGIGAGVIGAGLAGAAALGASALIPEVEKKVPVSETPKVAPLAMADTDIDGAIAGGGLPKWLLPLLGLLLLAGLFWWLMRGCQKEPVAAVVETPVMVDSTTVSPDSIKVGSSTSAAAGIQMEGFAPVVLYFENDQPNKNSKEITTQSTYTQTFEKYMTLKNKYSAEQDTPEAKAAIEDFFDNKVKKGYLDLKEITAKIAEALKAGDKVEITVKGFASPLAQNDYNINLTKRRISSIQNYLESYEGGILKQYIDKINITQQANGEDSSVSGLSDDNKNTKLSIYDLAPSKERRVEIVDVRFVK